MRDEVDHGLRDVLRTQLPLVVRVRMIHEIGVHRSWLYVADADAIVPHLLHQRLTERVDGGFRGAIRGATHEGVAARQAADVDDVAATTPAQVRDDGLAAVENARDVRVHHTPPFVVPLGFQRAEPPDARVVDEDVHTALAPRRL